MCNQKLYLKNCYEFAFPAKKCLRLKIFFNIKSETVNLLKIKGLTCAIVDVWL